MGGNIRYPEIKSNIIHKQTVISVRKESRREISHVTTESLHKSIACRLQEVRVREWQVQFLLYSSCYMNILVKFNLGQILFVRLFYLKCQLNEKSLLFIYN